MEQLKKLVAEVLDIDENIINDELLRDATSEWDSFNHLLLINHIEKNMGIKFTMTEVEQIKSYKQLRLIVESKG